MELAAAVAAAHAEGVPGVSVLSRSAGLERGSSTGVLARLVPSADSDALIDVASDALEPVTPSTLFDLASVSKLFTAVVVVRLAQDGVLDLDMPVSAVLPGMKARDVTARDLLSHTAGLPPTVAPWLVGGDPERRRARVLAVAPTRPRRTRYEYSCVGFVVAGMLAERACGAGLDDLVAEIISRPLGLSALAYGPTDPRACAATEVQGSGPLFPDRGLVWGEVHDECAWSLGGVAGNAGLFGTAEDLVRFGEMIAGGGAREGTVVLTETSVRAMVADQLGGVPSPGQRFGQGLGFRRGHLETMGTTDGTTVGHSGFTGTSLVIDLRSGRVTAILTNAVHPRRGVVDRAGVLSTLALATSEPA